MTHKPRLVALGAVAALVVAGCGGGNDNSNKTASYSDFSAQASKICTEAKPAIQAATKKLTGKASQDAATWDEIVSKTEPAVQKFKGLKPPDVLKADFARFTSITDQQLAAYKKAQAAAKAGDQAAYSAAVKQIEKSPLDTQSDDAASKLGATGCIG